MSLPGLPKTKISLGDARKSAATSAHNAGSLKARAGGLSSAQRTSVFTRALGTGGRPANWVGAQRGINPYDNISMQTMRHNNMRAELNRSAGRYNSRSMPFESVSNINDTMTDMMKAAMGVQIGMQAAQSIFGMLNKMGVFGGDTPGTLDTGGKAPAGGLDQLTSGISTAGSLTSQLTGAGSFAELDTLEARANEQKANLDTGYKQLDISKTVQDSLSGEGVQDGLQLAGVKIDTSALQLSSLDSNDLEASLKTIENDVNEITNFRSELTAAKGKVTEQSGIIGQQLKSNQISLDLAINQKTTLESQMVALEASGGDTSTIKTQITELETKIDELMTKKYELEQDKAKIDAASAALAKVDTQCEGVITDLKGKQAEIQDLQQFEASVKDKEYQMAKSQDEQLKKTMDSIDKLTKQIDSMADNDPSKSTNADQNRIAKYNALIQQRAGLYETLGKLTESLSSAGQTEFTDSNNKVYTLKNLDRAMNYGQAPEVTPLPQGDAGTQASPPGNTDAAGNTGALGDDSDTSIADMGSKSAVDEGRSMSPEDVFKSLILNAKTSGSASFPMLTLEDGYMTKTVNIDITCNGDNFTWNGKSYSEQELLAALNKEFTLS